MRSQYDSDIIEAMETYGGNFAKALAKAALYADPHNFDLIKSTWADLWEDYRQFLPIIQQRRKQCLPPSR